MATKKRFTRWAAGIILFVSLIAIVVTGFGTDGFGGLGSLGGGGAAEGETLVTVDGTTFPRMAKTLLHSSTALLKSPPVSLNMAVKNRLPKLWPAMSPFVKR